MSERNMFVSVDMANIKFLILEQEWMFRRRFVVLAVGEK